MESSLYGVAFASPVSSRLDAEILLDTEKSCIAQMDLYNLTKLVVVRLCGVCFHGVMHLAGVDSRQERQTPITILRHLGCISRRNFCIQVKFSSTMVH